MRDKSDLYYECHVTLEPPNSTVQRQIIEKIAAECDFRLAKFEMMKGDQPKAFITARGESYSSICIRAKFVCEKLKKAKFQVLRCKVEDTLLDTEQQHDFWGFTGGPNSRETSF